MHERKAREENWSAEELREHLRRSCLGTGNPMPLLRALGLELGQAVSEAESLPPSQPEMYVSEHLACLPMEPSRFYALVP